MPALGMAQETGTLIKWLKQEGESVVKGEPLIEIETDKVTVEIEALMSGILVDITAKEGDVVPVGQAIGYIVPLEEYDANPPQPDTAHSRVDGKVARPGKSLIASPVATRMAVKHGVELREVPAEQARVMKADVQKYLQRGTKATPSLLPASPKARRLATENGLDLAIIAATGPNGAVVTADIMTAISEYHMQEPRGPGNQAQDLAVPEPQPIEISRGWSVMAQRTAESWRDAPHFILFRDVDGARLKEWLQTAQASSLMKITYTDLLVKLAAAALKKHPRLNARWSNGSIFLNPEIDICLAVAIPDGLITPIIRAADTLTIGEVAEQRRDLIEKARLNQLRLSDVSGGTFTISNLGMYNVDAFAAIINAPQAAILAVGRLADRVVPVDGKPGVRPQMTLSLSCDHRVVDGARAAAFLDDLASLIQEPLGLFN